MPRTCTHARVQGNGRRPARADQRAERRGHVLPGRRRGPAPGGRRPPLEGARRGGGAGGADRPARGIPLLRSDRRQRLRAADAPRARDPPGGAARPRALPPGAGGGGAAPAADSFATPLDRVPVDTAWIRRALELPFVRELDPAFEREHSLEVHLPFLMRVLPRFSLVPLLVGTAAPSEIDALLEALWGGPETVIVISSDLSHYLDYESARRLRVRVKRTFAVAPRRRTGCRVCSGYTISGRQRTRHEQA